MRRPSDPVLTRLLVTSSRSLPRCVCVGAIALLTATIAVASATPAVGPKISLRISTGYASRTLTLCGDRGVYRYFHRGERILVRGVVRPKPIPRSWYVTIRRYRCVDKTWQGNLGDITVRGGRNGSYRAVYRATLRGSFSVHVIYGSGAARVESATYHLIVR